MTRFYTPAPIKSAFNLGDMLVKLALGGFGLFVGVVAALFVRGEFLAAVHAVSAALPR